MSRATTRRLVFDAQSAAFERAYGGLTGHRCERPDGSSSGYAACPLCCRLGSAGEHRLTVFHRPAPSDRLVTLEHAPQRRGRGDLGGDARPAGLTCGACNALAGARFEGDAHRDARVLDQYGVDACHGLHRSARRSSQGLILPTRHSAAATLADVKTAYLLAFTTLGHRWAFCSVLDPVRAAIANGIADSTCAVRVHVGAGGVSECVLVIDDPMPCVAVIGTGGQAILLPRCGSAADLERMFSFVTAVTASARWKIAEQHPWPTPNWFQDVGRRPVSAFHWDFCTKLDHPRCDLYVGLLPDGEAVLGSPELVKAEHASAWSPDDDGH